MKRLIFLVSALVAIFSLLIYNQYLTSLLSLLSIFQGFTPSSTGPDSNNDNYYNHTTLKNISEPMLKAAMTKTLQHAKIIPHRSATRGHGDHGWLNSYHSFSFADWYDPRFTSFGALRVLNEDRVKAQSGFPTHPHRDFEIFSYILSGELTHRDSMLRKGAEGSNVSPDKFYRMHRGDVQFTTGGTGIAHSEMNEHRSDTVHFLQIWALPWKTGLTPRYHTRHFAEEDKRKGFVVILSPLAAGPEASKKEEEEAKPAVEGTIPIHADFVMGAGIIAPEGEKKVFEWKVGADARFSDEDGEKKQASKRKVFVHLPMTKGGKSKVKLDGREDVVLSEGDGAFIDGLNAGDRLVVESVGSVEAEVIVLDSRA